MKMNIVTYISLATLLLIAVVGQDSILQRASTYLHQNQPLRAFEEINTTTDSGIPVLWTKAIAALQANRKIETDKSLISKVDYLKHAHNNLEHVLKLVKDESKRASVLELLSYASRRLGRYQDAFKQMKELIRLRNGDVDSQISSALGAIAEKNPSSEIENDLIEICSRRLEMECAELVVYVIATRIVLGSSVSYERWHKWTQILHLNNTLHVPSFRVPEQSVLLSQNPVLMIVDDVFSQEFLSTLEFETEMIFEDYHRQSFPTCYLDIPNSEIRRSHRWYQVDRWMCADDVVETSQSRSSFIHHNNNYFRKHILDTFEVLFGLSPQHAYPTQLLAYEEDATYGRHTDCSFRRSEIHHDRVFTVLLYLNQNQASTKFPLLNLEVEPLRGRVVMFSSTNERGYCDPRSAHESIHLGHNDGKKLVLQQWYARHEIVGGQGSPKHVQMSELTRAFPNGYVSCDGRGCRSYVPFEKKKLSRRLEGEL